VADSILNAREVRVDYRTADGVVTAITQVTFAVPSSGLTVLSGPSGSGKSTLLAALGLLRRPTAGTVELHGEPISAQGNRALRRLRRHRIASVFQNPADNLLAHLSVAGNIRAAAQSSGRPDPGSALLDRVGLHGTGRWHITALSGGQQQRLALACCLARGAEVILTDEPTSQLDAASAGLVLESLATLTAHGLPIVVATHDPRVSALASTVARLRDGELVDRADR
jgi:putative ABC transport system ATP-binding protein